MSFSSTDLDLENVRPINFSDDDLIEQQLYSSQCAVFLLQDRATHVQKTIYS